MKTVPTFGPQRGFISLNKSYSSTMDVLTSRIRVKQAFNSAWSYRGKRSDAVYFPLRHVASERLVQAQAKARAVRPHRSVDRIQQRRDADIRRNEMDPDPLAP